jgi:hypothetical protein
MAFTYNTDGYAETSYFLVTEESFSATSLAVSTGTGSINSAMGLLGYGFSLSTSTSVIDLAMDLFGGGFTVNLGSGSIYSTMGLSGNGYALAVSHARLSFPSIWVGKLSIIPSHTKYEIIPNHTKYEIRTLT